MRKIYMKTQEIYLVYLFVFSSATAKNIMILFLYIRSSENILRKHTYQKLIKSDYVDEKDKKKKKDKKDKKE